MTTDQEPSVEEIIAGLSALKTRFPSDAKERVWLGAAMSRLSPPSAAGTGAVLKELAAVACEAVSVCDNYWSSSVGRKEQWKRLRFTVATVLAGKPLNLTIREYLALTPKAAAPGVTREELIRISDRIDYFGAGRDEGTMPTWRDFDELLAHAVKLKSLVTK